MTNVIHEPAFPDFLFGSVASLQRKIKVEGKKWANQYREDKTFPTPLTASMPLEAVVLMDASTDLVHEVAQWRIYFVRLFAGAICQSLDWQNYEQVNVDFETHTLKFSWGALDALIEHVVPNSINNVSRRIEAVLLFWEPLSTLSYLDKNLQPVNLEQLLSTHFGHLLEMWGVHRSDDIRLDLKKTIDVMRKASPGVVQDKVVACLLSLSQVDTRIKHPEQFRNQVWLNEELAKLEQPAYENLTTGYPPDLLRTLYILDDSIKN